MLLETHKVEKDRLTRWKHFYFNAMPASNQKTDALIEYSLNVNRTAAITQCVLSVKITGAKTRG